jgi:hypothetical protein
MIVVQHAAETLTSQDAATHGCVSGRCHDELVVEALMVAFPVVVLDILSNELTR